MDIRTSYKNRQIVTTLSFFPYEELAKNQLIEGLGLHGIEFVDVETMNGSRLEVASLPVSPFDLIVSGRQSLAKSTVRPIVDTPAL